MEYEFDIDINELLSIRRSHCMTDASCQTDMESDLTDSSCQTDTVCDPTDSSCQTDMESDPTDSSCQTDLTARTNTVVAHEVSFRLMCSMCNFHYVVTANSRLCSQMRSSQQYT